MPKQSKFSNHVNFRVKFLNNHNDDWEHNVPIDEAMCSWLIRWLSHIRSATFFNFLPFFMKRQEKVLWQLGKAMIMFIMIRIRFFIK